MKLKELISENTVATTCRCPRCHQGGLDVSPLEPGQVDLTFFRVHVKPDSPLTADAFVAATAEYTGPAGLVLSASPLSGVEFPLQIVALWMGGDQHLALRYMAAGGLLGVFDLSTATGLFDEEFTEEHPDMVLDAAVICTSIKAIAPYATGIPAHSPEVAGDAPALPEPEKPEPGAI